MPRKTHQRGQGITGHTGGVQHLMPPLSSSLYRLARQVIAEDASTRAAADVVARARRETLLTDEQVIAFRTLRERDHVPLKALARQFDVTYPYACALAQYRTRSKLFPRI